MLPSAAVGKASRLISSVKKMWKCVVVKFRLSRVITERIISNEAMASYARPQEAVSHLGQMP
jgi:hypothetical protein